MDTITVIYDGTPMIVSSAVAVSLGLKNGQTVKTEAEFWEILRANASYNIAICSAKLNECKN